MTWLERIERAEKKGKFIVKDKQLAHDFNSCAIGERFTYKGYKDFSQSNSAKFWKLNDLGYDFWNAVLSNNIKEAKKVYNKIQRYKI